MSVFMRGSAWHYRFNYSRRTLSGRCEGCATMRQAQAFEKEMRRKAVELYGLKSVKALVENYRAELSGGRAETVPLSGVPSMSGVCRRSSRARSAWGLFSRFMSASHPEAADVAALSPAHFEGFYRWCLESRHSAVSTLRNARNALHAIMEELKERAGLPDNPVAKLKAPRGAERYGRQIFTDDELARIYERAAEEPAAGTLFLVAGATGLTEGDICTLRWDEISWDDMTISRKRRKTGVPLLIPVMPSLASMLKARSGNGSAYVFPELAATYLRRPATVSAMVRKFLEGCGIDKAAETPSGRKVSVKDLHSMRHVFCYRAGKAGIPLATVQAIVGHMTPEMTRHYMAHSSLRDRREAMLLMPDFISGETGAVEADRVTRLAREINALAPEDRARLRALTEPADNVTPSA